MNHRVNSKTRKHKQSQNRNRNKRRKDVHGKSVDQNPPRHPSNEWSLMLMSPRLLWAFVPVLVSKFRRAYARPSMERDRVCGSLRLHPRGAPPQEFVLRFFLRRDATDWSGHGHGYGRSVRVFRRIVGDGGCTKAS